MLVTRFIGLELIFHNYTRGQGIKNVSSSVRTLSPSNIQQVAAAVSVKSAGNVFILSLAASAIHPQAVSGRTKSWFHL